MNGADANGDFHGDDGRYVSLRSHIEEIMDERDVRYRERWEAQRREVSLAQQGMERRLEKLNDLDDYVTRDKYDIDMKPLQDLRSKAVIVVGAVALFSGGVGAVIAALLTKVITGGGG